MGIDPHFAEARISRQALARRSGLLTRSTHQAGLRTAIAIVTATATMITATRAHSTGPSRLPEWSDRDGRRALLLPAPTDSSGASSGRSRVARASTSPRQAISPRPTAGTAGGLPVLPVPDVWRGSLRFDLIDASEDCQCDLRLTKTRADANGCCCPSSSRLSRLASASRARSLAGDTAIGV